MRLLVYDWAAWNREDFYATLKKMNIEYDLFTWNLVRDGHRVSEDEEFVDWFMKEVDASRYDAVMSLNIWEPVSKACEEKGMKYIAWSYDSPIDLKHPENTFSNEFCSVFLYDRFETEKYRNQGYANVYYMPLGVNTERYSKYDYYKKECDKYRTDISFVGGLYNNLFGGVMGFLDEKTQGVLNQIIEVQMKMPPGQYVLDQVLTDGLITLVSDQLTSKIPGYESVTRKQLEFTMSQEITRRERIILLNLCAARYKTDLYSNQTFEVLKSVNQKSTVDYLTQMPLVFAASKINLNPALFAIRSGISLRAFDIMACGGFLLSNYKEEYRDYFEIDKEMVIYTSMEDAVDKINYYMSNEDIRVNIAKAGKNRVKKDHKLEYRLRDIFEIVGL